MKIGKIKIDVMMWVWLAIATPAIATPLRVSVITCAPGKEVYELYGHTALRIKGADFDSVWNYGVFDFNEPNFVGRFVKGDLMYMVAGYPFDWFMPEYVENGRRVEEQVLNLTVSESETLRKSLQTNALPQNRRYPYDYVKDNCSTRIMEQIKTAAPLAQPSGDTKPQQATFRNAMRRYHSHYPWYSFGIDVALGYPVDTAITADDLLFLPGELNKRLASTTKSDGSPLVKETVVLNEGFPDATLPPTPWWLTPQFWAWILFAAALIYEWQAWRKGRSLKIFEAIYFACIGLAGCVIAYLVFISSHKAASPNLLLIWLNPLALIVPLCIWWRKGRPIVAAYMIANVFALLGMAFIWPFQHQSGNATFIPLGATDLLLAAFYVALYGKNKRK